MFRYKKKEVIFIRREKTIGELFLRGEMAFRMEAFSMLLLEAETANSAQFMAKSSGYNYSVLRSVHSAERLILGSNQGEETDGTHPDYDFSGELGWWEKGFLVVVINGQKRLNPDKAKIISLVKDYLNQ